MGADKLEWLSKTTIGIILLLEVILIGIFGYSQNVSAVQKSLMVFGASIIFVGYLITFKLRGDILEFFIGPRDRKKDKTLIKTMGMLVFLIGVIILGLIFAI